MFQCTSKLRAADANIVLNLTTKHCLEYGDSESSNTARKSRFPANIDIFPASVIVFSFSAVLNRKPLASDVLIKSQLAYHFLEFLQSNADQLGLGTVSALYLDAGCPKIDVSINRTRLPFHNSVPVRVVLRTIHLQYSVSTKQTKTCDGDLDLFSTRLSLPYRSIVDNILKRFVTFHLVKRYPLIFGTVCQQLDLETPYFPKIFGSILEMAKRSPNPAFRSKFKQSIKAMKHIHQSDYISTSAALTTYLNDSAESELNNDHDAGDVDEVEIPEIENETALCLSMEKLFCIGMKQSRFKSIPGLFLPMVLTDTQDDDELSKDHCAITETTNSTCSSSGFCLSSSTPRSPVLLHDSDEETDDIHLRMLDDEKNYFDHPFDSTDMGVGMTMDMDGHLQNSTHNPSQNLAPVILNPAFDASADLDEEGLLSPALSLPQRSSLFLDTSGNETESAVATHSYSSSEIDLDFELDTDGFSDLDLARNADGHLAYAPYSCVHDNHHPVIFPKFGSTLGSSTNAPRTSTRPAPFDDLDTDVDMDIMDMLHVPPGLDPTTEVDSTHIICDFGLGLDEGHDNLDIELDIDSDYSDYSDRGFDLNFDDLHSNEATPVPLSLPQPTQTQTYATETSLALPVPPWTKRGGMNDNTGLGLKLFSDDMELLYDDDEEQEQTQSHSISRISSSLDSPGACNEHSLFSYSSASPSTPSFHSSSGKPTRSPLQQRQDQDQWHPLDADDSDDEEESATRAKADTDLDLVFFDLDTAPVTPMLKLLETNLNTNLGTGTNRNSNSQLFSKLGSDSKTHLDLFFSSSSNSNYLVEIATVDCQKSMDGTDKDNISILS